MIMMLLMKSVTTLVPSLDDSLLSLSFTCCYGYRDDLVFPSVCRSQDSGSWKGFILLVYSFHRKSDYMKTVYLKSALL
jgi:hypothetical protein